MSVGATGLSARIRLRLLGRFAVGIDLEDAPPRVAEISGKLRRALIGYLAMQPGFAETRERLAALLWGESADKQARQSLRQCLLDLRREFAEFGVDPLTIGRETVALDAELVSVDARQFLTLARSNDPNELEQAAALHTGVFLEGIDLDVEAYNSWLHDERVLIESSAALVFEKQAQQRDNAGNGVPAVRAAERLVALDPLREHAQRLLLRLLARYRGRDAALAHANALIAMLAAELDTEPEPETAALIEQIRSSPAAAQAPLTVRRGSVAARDTAPELDVAPARAGFLGSRTFAWSAAGVVALALLAVAAVARYEFSLPAGPGAVDQAWQPPHLLPGITANDRQFAAEGISPLVVLPFAADGPDGGPDQRMADHVTADLISDLSRVPALRVISRLTSRLYRGRTIDVSAIGAELGVRYVVEGDVRLDGSQLRVNVALTDTKTRLQVWSERFERDGIERPAMQDEIAHSLARQLHISLLKAEDERRLPDNGSDPAVADLVAKGWGAILRAARQSMTTTGADSFFEQALKREPDNSSALTGLGAYHASVAADFLVSDPERHLKRAEEALGKALALRPDNAVAHYFMGVVHKVRGQPHAALASFAKAIEINPSFAPAYSNYAHVLYRTGKLDEAIEHVRYAMRLSPKDPNLGRWALVAGEIEIERGRDEAAIEWLRKSVEVGAGGPFNDAALAAAYSLHGDSETAKRYAAKVRAEAPWLTIDVMLQRLVGMSEAGSEPHRLIQGLNTLFAANVEKAATAQH